MAEGFNPITGMDYPDPDVIRVGDTYYMISTTMHFFPGGNILKSHDLIHWEHCAYVRTGSKGRGGNSISRESTTTARCCLMTTTGYISYTETGISG